MTANHIPRGRTVTPQGDASRVTGFTLIELLTVIFIISLLIAILIPSLTGARTAAKKTVTSAALNALKTGLEMFKNDNEREFRQTNGYPPSFSYPRIPEYTFYPEQGQFPFIPGATTDPTVYGAQWLPAMLVGYDSQGFIKRSSVPSDNNGDPLSPHSWYTADPLGDGTVIERMPLYVDPSSMRMTRTEDLPGTPNTDDFFNHWDLTKHLPVITDAFDQPILYYVANRYGRQMVGDTHSASSGPHPYYFHEDNEAFTGSDSQGGAEAPGGGGGGGQLQPGWDFGGGEHAIAEPGNDLTPSEIVDATNRNTFARYILDRHIWSILQLEGNENVLLRPVNPDSYLLISAGPDGLYGTNDDVTNMPPWPE